MLTYAESLYELCMYYPLSSRYEIHMCISFSVGHKYGRQVTVLQDPTQEITKEAS